MDKENRLVPVQGSRVFDDAETTALVPIAVDELATTLVAVLDRIAAIIPDLRTPHPATEKEVRGARTVPRDAIVSIVAMVEACPALQDLLNTGRAHEVLEFDDGFRVLDERLDRLRRQVRYTIEARWAETVAQAMNAYYMAKRLVKEPRYADLAAHIDKIRKHLNRTNGPAGKEKTSSSKKKSG
jgi:hypothetical protein